MASGAHRRAGRWPVMSRQRAAARMAEDRQLMDEPGEVPALRGRHAGSAAQPSEGRPAAPAHAAP